MIKKKWKHNTGKCFFNNSKVESLNMHIFITTAVPSQPKRSKYIEWTTLMMKTSRLTLIFVNVKGIIYYSLVVSMYHNR